jgi:hypothetical protein
MVKRARKAEPKDFGLGCVAPRMKIVAVKFMSDWQTISLQDAPRNVQPNFLRFPTIIAAKPNLYRLVEGNFGEPEPSR